jgi:dihydrofolate reductase
MAKLIYSMITSLDGYIEDEGGRFDWAEPDEEVHAFVNDRYRPVGTYLYGRRLYEMMAGWETDPAAGAASPVAADFAAIWQAADKVVYSTTLADVSTARTRIERTFDPVAVRAMVAEAERDVTVGGATLGAHALRAGIVDEIHLVVAPAVVGGGKPALPDGVRLGLELLDERPFAGGMVHLRYGVAPGG